MRRWPQSLLRGIERKGKDAVIAHSTVYDLLSELRYDTRAVRVAVVKCHNGGTIPSAKTPLYSTALYEVADNEHGPIRDKWRSLPIDARYTQLLTEMMEKGSVHIDVSSADLGGTLGAIYGTALVQTVRKYHLAHDALGIYYLSVQWPDAGHAVTAPQALSIQAALPKLRDALKAS